jgi:hypothetical protein
VLQVLRLSRFRRCCWELRENRKAASGPVAAKSGADYLGGCRVSKLFVASLLLKVGARVGGLRWLVFGFVLVPVLLSVLCCFYVNRVINRLGLNPNAFRTNLLNKPEQTKARSSPLHPKRACLLAFRKAYNLNHAITYTPIRIFDPRQGSE